MSWRRMFYILWRLQLQRVRNRLGVWSRPGGILGGLVLLGIILIGLHLVLSSSLDRLFNPDAMREAMQKATGSRLDLLRYTRYEDVPDQSARLMLIFLQGTWFAALFLKWGHWQSLQRDAEWEWFAEKPWPPWILFVQRCLVESLWPQVFSLFLGSFFFILGLKRGLSPLTTGALTLGLILLFQALLAAPRLTWDLWMKQRWPAAHVRTFRGLSGMMGAGLLLLSMQALSLDQHSILQWVERFGKSLDQTPGGLALSTLIVNDQASVVRNLGVIFTLVLGTHLFCYAVAARILRQPFRGFQGWFARSRLQSNPRLGPFAFLWQRLHPVTRRDLILLGRDRHFTLQLLVAPLIVVLLPQGLSQSHSSWVWIMAFGTGFLFLWSAVFHILSMEGRSLWMIFTWPMSLAQFLWRRLQVLLVLAGTYTFLVLGLGLGRQARLDASLELWRLPYLVLGLLAFALLLTAVAVFSHEAESRMEPDRPRFLWHYALLFPSGLYGWLFLRPQPWESFFGLMILGLASALVWWHMMRRLPGLLESPSATKNNLARVTLRLYLLKFKTR